MSWSPEDDYDPYHYTTRYAGGMSGQTTLEDWTVYQNIETGIEVPVTYKRYVEREGVHVFAETETWMADDVGHDWDSENEMRQWFARNGYTEDY